MKIRVSATRMELLKLKRRLSLAVRGHRLLKDKQDELVRQFFLRQEKYRDHLALVRKAVGGARRAQDLLRSAAPGYAVHLDSQSAAPAPLLQDARARVLNLSVPTYLLPDSKPMPMYGLLECAGRIENVLEEHLELLPLLVRKADMEKTMQAILREIEVTRRRVNALEYKLIPTLRDSINSITAKLGELELSTLTRLMRVKEIIEQGRPSSGTPREKGHGPESQ